MRNGPSRRRRPKFTTKILSGYSKLLGVPIQSVKRIIDMALRCTLTLDTAIVITASVATAMAVVHYTLLGLRSRKESREAGYPPLAPTGIGETIQQISGSNYPWFMLRMAKEATSFTFRLNLPVFGTPMVVVVGEVETHRAILTHRATDRPVELMYKTFDNVTGGVPTIFSTNGEYWHKRRKLIAPAFEKSHIARMNRVVLSKTENWIKTRLQPMMQRGEAFEVGKEMVGMILSSHCETAFQYQLTAMDQTSYLHDLEVCLKEFLFKSSTNPFRPLLGRLLPERRRAYHAAERLMSFAKKIIENYRMLELPLEDTIIDRIMKSDVYKNDREIQADIVFLLLAGHDTTAYSIAWTLLELARHPEHLKSLRKSFPASPAQESQKSSPLQNVIKEAMRLHPAVTAGSVRRIGESMKTNDGFFLPVGSVVFLPLILLLRNPSVFENPDQYQPTRWDIPTKAMVDSFLPFSLGKQNCVGQALAKVEIESVVARICNEFDLAVAEEGTAEFLMTLKPVGAKLIATRVEAHGDNS